MSFGSRLSPQVTDAEGMQAVDLNRIEREQAPLHPHNDPRTPLPRDVVQDHGYNEQRDHNTRSSREWTQWIPPKGRVRWGYVALISLLLVAVIVAPAVIGEKLRKAEREASEASKPLFTETYETLTMPIDTSRIFRDPYNTTGIYRVSVGEDRRGNDIFATIEYTIEACLLACNKYNEFIASGRSPCVAGTMNYNQKESAIGQTGANCFLKTKVGNDIDITNPMALGFRLCRFRNCSSSDSAST